MIAEQRIAGGRQARLPHPHADPRDHELRISGGEPRPHREQAEQPQGPAQDQPPLIAVRQAPERDAGDDVEQPEGDTLQQKKMGIVQPEASLDRRHRQVDDGAVELRDHRRERQEQDDQPAAQRARPPRPGFSLRPHRRCVHIRSVRPRGAQPLMVSFT